MGQREDLARQLGERVARYRDTGEARYVVGLDTLAQAAALLRLTVAHEADDKAAAHRRRFRRRRARDRSWETLAEVFWCRFAARPDSDEGLTDVATALDVVTGPLTHGDLQRMPDYLVAGLALHQTRLTAYAAGDDGGFEERMVRAAAVLRTPPSACSREALRQAADDYRHVLRYASMRSPDYAELLADTGTALMMLFGGEQDGWLLDEAERLRRRRLAVEARGGDGRARALTDLIACLRRRWEHQQDPSVLRECAALGGELADSPPDAPGVRMTTLFWSGQVLHNLAAASGDTEVSVRALQLLRAAAETAESQHDLYAHVSIAYELSCALLGQYRAGHGLPALREAYDQAVVATALGVHPDLAAFYAHRMVVGRELAAATGDVPLMREAADLGRSALSVSSCQDDDPNRPLIHGEFSTTLHALYALTGDIDVLQHAVVAARDCEAAHPPDDPRRPAALGLLCELLMEQYAAQPNGTTLGEALHAARQAVDACPPGNPHRPRCLLRLSKALFLLTVPDALDEAVELAEEAAREMPLDHPERPLALAQLAACLTRSFELGVGDTMARVVEVTRDALRALPRDAPVRAGVLVNLSSALRIRARQDTGIRVLEEAAEIAREAVAAAPGNAYTHAVLGFALQDRYEREPSSTVLRGARQAFAAAVETDGLPAAVRLKAYRALAWSHMASEDPASALAACERAVDLLPGIASMVLWHRDRRRALLGTAGLASEAASAAVAAGRPDRAVELLERARGTVLTETMDRRGMLAVLAGRDRELAGRYDDLLQEVEFFDTDPDGLAILAVPGQLGGPDPMPRAGGREAGFDFDGPSREQLLSMLARIQARRQELSALWEQLLGRIRRLDGFEDFMRPLSAEELRREAADGPIVLLNASRYRGDALIVSTDAIRSVPLDGVDRDTVVRQVDRLYAALASASADSMRERRRGQQALSELLGWLWDRIADPVLEALGRAGRPSDDIEEDGPPPRVWWCPIGEAAPLPLHAAGHHAAGGPQTGRPRTVLDRVVSSYTPTIRALRHARAQRARLLWESGPVPRPDAEAAAERAGRPGALVVAVPEVPGAQSPPLHGVLPEARRVCALIPHSVLLSGSAADKRAVSEALPHHGLVHFACHGLADWSDPDSSTLLLHDHAHNPFTLADVARRHLPGAALAFLSACDTTGGNAPRLHDEAVHIASAFQLAGYRGVIGTLWPVNDKAAQQISDIFYATLTLDGTAALRPERAPFALHRAVRELRAKCADSPSLWAAHLHVGL
ncbi:MAG: CHAT domain-containing protein [Streptomycetaceae bacterium]|nr:CHAT domain-containing protein [Streptomycetaceae bacterium]